MTQQEYPQVYIENLDRLIEAIEGESCRFHDTPVHFNMGYWLTYIDPECGTMACIGGHCKLLWGEENIYGGAIGVGLFLGLLETEARLLCYLSRNSYGDYEQVTKEQALTVLKHLRETGEVDWGVAGLQECVV